MRVEGKEVVCNGKHWIYIPRLHTPTPIPTATPTRRWTMPEYELPRIEGDIEFVDNIRDGLNWLWENQPRLFQFIVDHIDRITPASDGVHGRAYFDHAHVEIGQTPWIRHEIFVSSVLLHEACHMRQFRKNPHMMAWASDWQIIEQEKECFQAELVFLEHIGWGDSWIARLLRGSMPQSYEEWLEYAQLVRSQ